MMAHYDMVVIGSGPAGQKAAIQGAKVGKKIGIVERKKFVGGLCINSGMIPSKSLREPCCFFQDFGKESHTAVATRRRTCCPTEFIRFRKFQWWAAMKMS
jgi:NAD(P) transhydrogenase